MTKKGLSPPAQTVNNGGRGSAGQSPVPLTDMARIFESAMGPRLLAGALRNALSLHHGQLSQREHHKARVVDERMSDVLARRQQVRAMGTMFEHWKQYRLLKAVNGGACKWRQCWTCWGCPWPI